METIDYVIIIFYFIAIGGFGLYFHEKSRSDEDFALAGRQLSASWIGLSAFASWVGLAGVFGTPENVYKYGLSGSWWFYGWLPGILLMAYLLASRLRERLHVTVADLVSQKSAPGIRILASLVTSWNYLAWAAVQLFALNLILKTFTNVDPTTGSVIIFLVVITYTLIGGMRFIVATDVVQASIFIVAIVVLAPFFALKAAGGWSSVYQNTQTIPGFYTIFQGAGGKTLMLWFISLLPAAFIDPGGLQRVFSARSPDTAKKGLYISAAIYLIFGLAITFLGIVAKSILPDIEPQKVMPMLMSQIMPMGLKGLSIAAFIAVAMSTADTALLVVATTVQRDIYAHLRPKITDTERIIVSRCLIVVLGLLALIIAIKSESVVTILLLGFSVYVPGLLLPVVASSYHLHIPSWAMLSTIMAGAGGAAVWSIIKEPFVPAVIAGLLMSCIPFCLGLLKKSEIG